MASSRSCSLEFSSPSLKTTRTLRRWWMAANLSVMLKKTASYEGGAEFAFFFGTDLGEVHVAFVEAADAIHDGGRGRAGVADEAEVVAEAEGEGLVVGFEDLVEKGFDVLLVFLHEFFLASAFVDDEADAERELLVVSKETDL